MIDWNTFFQNRDIAYKDFFTEEIGSNAIETMKRANQLLIAFGEDRDVTSGWRPPQINARTPGAAPNSKHLTGEAIDLADPDGDLDEWCLAHPAVLETIGLWQEHPATTKGWCHVQIVPPKSGNRVFYP